MSEDLARGLSFLHENGIVHLDIKPHNMVYDERFNLYLIDFGASEKVEGVQSTIDEVRGTELWMAPGLFTEVKKGPYSPILADCFSCGCIFEQINSYLGNKQLAEFTKKLQTKCPSDRLDAHRAAFRVSVGHLRLWSARRKSLAQLPDVLSCPLKVEG
ncbi:kinase-like domain-containing protein [Rhodocollybia butyracea]|uniref:Kinase-like domain-containing protein n=1 Tax=Rhodocollybia butyracea TaxID=206335 RepID=A0A9P5TZD6_9AGAR|nr:kinase-like domain-containing protein [Rhodocollybia butyracea]